MKFFAATLLFAFSCLAAMAAKPAGGYTIVTADDHEVGSFGGVYTTLNGHGDAVQAVLVISANGYLLPLTSTGDAGLFQNTWYTEAGCSGDEYLSLSSNANTNLPLSGMVYRSVGSGQLRYIPQFTVPEQVAIQSHMYFKDGRLQCAAFKQNLSLLPTLENNPDMTGFRSSDTGHAVALRPTHKPAGTAPLTSSSPARIEAPIPVDQQECSAGCTMGDIGNNVCDIGCYVNECSYDGGDCDNETPEFLQEELNKFCSPGCTVDDLGDGFCDTACNNNACEFDRGDCANN